MTQDPSRTVHAQQAMEITDLFSYKFGALRFGQSTPRRLKLQEPDGPSTAGGRQARQSLVLIPDGEAPQTTVLGWVDSVQRRGEIKSLAALGQHYRQRFDDALDLEVAEFDRMVAELRGFLKIQKIDLVMAEAPPAPLPRPRAPAPQPDRGPVGMVIAAFVTGIVLGFTLGYLVFGT